MFPCPSKSKNVSYMPMVHDESGKNEHAALIFQTMYSFCSEFGGKTKDYGCFL